MCLVFDKRLKLVNRRFLCFISVTWWLNVNWSLCAIHPKQLHATLALLLSSCEDESCIFLSQPYKWLLEQQGLLSGWKQCFRTDSSVIDIDLWKAIVLSRHMTGLSCFGELKCFMFMHLSLTGFFCWICAHQHALELVYPKCVERKTGYHEEIRVISALLVRSLRKWAEEAPGVVQPKICRKCQDVDEYVSSSEQIWGNFVSIKTDFGALQQ